MPPNNDAGILESWTRFDNTKPNLGGFFGAIVNAMQNWQDNMQSQIPGFRDRIVHVYLSGSEGGLNLNMTPDLLNRLAARGTCAGESLVDHFQRPNPESCAPLVPQPTNWDNHRVVRYRTAMALLENWIRCLCSAYTPGYADLINRPLGTPPCSYPWYDETQRSYAATAIDGFNGLNSAWMQTRQSFAQGAPRPQPELSTRPRI